MRRFVDGVTSLGTYEHEGLHIYMLQAAAAAHHMLCAAHTSLSCRVQVLSGWEPTCAHQLVCGPHHGNLAALLRAGLCHWPPRAAGAGGQGMGRGSSTSPLRRVSR